MSEENPNDISMAQQEIDEISKIQFEEANFTKAQEYFERESVLDRSSDKPRKFSLNCDLNELKPYGIGLYFYFDILKKTAIFFFIASLICIPTLYSNCSGGGLGSSSSGISAISKCSLANQPTLSLEIPASSATQTEIDAVKVRNDARIAAYTDDMNYRKSYVWIPDLLYSILFLLFLIYFKVHSKRHKQKQTKVIQPSKYTIQMKGFPSNTTDPDQIENFIKEYYYKEFPTTQEPPSPLVMEVSFAKDFNDTLFLHKMEAKLLQQIQIERKKLQLEGEKLQREGKNQLNKKAIKKSTKLQEKEEKLQKIKDQVNKKVNKKVGDILKYEDYPSLSAFIIFNTFEQREQMIKIFLKYARPHWIFRYVLCCFRRKTDNEIKFKKIYTPIIIGEVDQPSNIKWENLDIKPPNRVLRSLVIIVAVLAIMLLTLAVLIAANTVKPANPASCPSNSYTYLQSISTTDSEVKRCYCLSLSTSEMLDNIIIQNYCWDIYIDNVKTQVLTILTTLAIVISNMILAVTLKKVSKFLRYKTVSSETTTSAILLFVCTFINTAILTLLLQGEIYGFAPAVVFTSPVPPLYDIQVERRGSFSTDFDRSWYTSVGQKLVLTMIISTVWPHIIDLILIPLSKRIRIRSAKSKVIQHEMNKLVVGPEFNLQQHYTSFLNIVFVCLFYSSGQPLLIPAGFVALATQYWIFKYRILRWHRKPIAFNSMLNSAIQKVLPWSLIFHLCIGIYMYGQPLIFPRNSEQLSAVISSSLNSAGVYSVVLTANQTAPIADRVYSSIVLFILLLIAAAFIIFDIAVSKIAQYILSKVLPCYFKSPSPNQVMPIASNDELTYTNQFKKMGQLASYNIRLNEQYSHLIQAIDMGSELNSNNNTPMSAPRNNTKENFTNNGQIIRPSQFQSANINNENNNINPSFEVLNGQNFDAIVPESLQKSPETEVLCQA